MLDSNMEGMNVRKRFSKGDFIHENHLNDLYKCICMSLVYNTPCYDYWYDQYNLANNLFIVIN